MIGVINRSQQDIINKKTIKQMLVDESKFFSEHPLYSHVAEKSGTSYLAKMGSKVWNFLRNFD